MQIISVINGKIENLAWKIVRRQFKRERIVIARPTELDVQKSIIFESVKKFAGNGLNSEILHELSKEIALKFIEAENTPIVDLIKENFNQMLMWKLINFTSASSRCVLWELKVKVLASHFKIDLFTNEDRSNAKSPVFKDLEFIIDDIKKVMPALDFGLNRIKNIRNELLHSNFHKLRTVMEESQRREVRNSYQGRVVSVDLKTGQANFMREIKDFEEIKNQGVFGWFLNASDSKLFDDAGKILNTALVEINDLIGFASFWSVESETSKRILCSGEKISGEFEKLLIDEWISAFPNDRSKISNIIKTINSKSRFNS